MHQTTVKSFPREGSRDNGTRQARSNNQGKGQQSRTLNYIASKKYCSLTGDQPVGGLTPVRQRDCEKDFISSLMFFLRKPMYSGAQPSGGVFIYSGCIRNSFDGLHSFFM
jgi:hypothetical protein